MIRVMTPNAKEFLIDTVAAFGIDRATLKMSSDFKILLELFVKYGVDVNHRNKKGVSPMLCLLRDRDLANAGFLDDLIAFGAEVNQPEDDSGSTPFLEAIYAYDKIVILHFIL